MVGLWWPFTGMGKIRQNRLGYNMIYEEFCLVYVNFVELALEENSLIFLKGLLAYVE